MLFSGGLGLGIFLPRSLIKVGCGSFLIVKPTDLAILLLMSLIFSIYIVGLYMDKKYNLRVMDWLNGECSTPFITANTT